MPIGVIGDIHEKFDVIRDKVKYYELENMILFQVGDFGVGFNYNNPREPIKEKRKLLMLNEFLEKRNIVLHVIRGNHDNPMFFDGKHNFTNIIFMQDYDLVDIGEIRVLGVGGATCVDRKPNHLVVDYRGKGWKGRREGIDWWADEKIVYDEEKVKNIFGVNVVLTHTAPDFVYPEIFHGRTIKKWIECDPELENELIEERLDVTKLYKELNKYNPIENWFYGHFHRTQKEKKDNTTFTLLDVNGFAEIKQKEDKYDF